MEPRIIKTATGKVTGNVMGDVMEGSSAPPLYVPNKVLYDGTNDGLLRSADFISNSNGRVGVFSCWFRIDGNEGTTRQFYRNSADRFNMNISSSNIVTLVARNSSATEILRVETNNAYLPSSTIHHVLASWNLNISEVNLYVDDISDNDVVTIVNDTINYSRNDHSVGYTVANVNYFNGCLFDVYLDINDYQDFSIAANRLKFGSASNQPVFLGANGEIPTNSQPILFLDNPFGTVNINKGYGGDFVINGSPTECV